MRRIAVAALCATLLAALDAASRGGDLDPTFGEAGRALIPQAPVALAVQEDGRVVTVTRGSTGYTLVRHLADGRPDPSFQGGTIGFGGSYQTAGVQAVAIAPDGGILVAGPLGDTCSRLAVARFDPQGRHDTTFGDAGSWRSACRPFPISNARVAALTDGAIAVYGEPYWFQSQEIGEPVIARIDARGRLDPSYGNGGYATAPFTSLYDPASVLLAADGSIEFLRYQPAGGGRYALWSSRLRPDGEVDRTPSGATEVLLAQPPPFTDGMRTVMLRDGTRLVLGAGDARVGVFAYGRDHQLIGAFGGGGSVDIGVAAKFPHPRAQHAHRTADGGLLLVISDVYGVEDYELVKLDARGALDRAFGSGGRIRFSAVPGQEWHLDAATRPDGHAVLAGGAFTGTGLDTGWLARLQVAGDVVEFHNTITDHYFVAIDGEEARGIDAGAAGPGWRRTGEAWKPGGPTPVCRFYGAGPNSHFFTADASECDIVRRSGGWAYEGLGFYVTPVANGSCAAPLRPVHRLYNNRAAQNDSNHRYVVDAGLVPAMTARGWVYEAVVFCAKP